MAARIPTASRPDMPAGYTQGRLLPWDWATARLVRARNYWICTTCPSGRPHARPVWGAWLDGCFVFSTGARIARNLDADARISVNLESGDETVILEGRAERVPAGSELARRFAEAYSPKYHWEMSADDPGVWVVRHRVAFGWPSDGSGLDGGAMFQATATRWSFDGD